MIEDENENNKVSNNDIWFLIGAVFCSAVFLIFGIIIFGVKFNPKEGWENFRAIVEIFYFIISIVLPCILGFFAFKGLKTIDIAFQQLKTQKEQFEKQIEIQKENSDAQNKQFQEQINLQTKHFEEQSFDNTFFNLIKIHNGIINSLLEENTEVIPFKFIPAGSFGTNEEKVLYKGIKVFSLIFEEIKKTFLERKKNQVNLNSDNDESIFIEITNGILKKYSDLLNHYFRSLFNIVKISKKANNEKYLEIIKSLISNDELILIALYLDPEKNSEQHKLVYDTKLVEHVYLDKNGINYINPSFGYGQDVYIVIKKIFEKRFDYLIGKLEKIPYKG